MRFKEKMPDLLYPAAFTGALSCVLESASYTVRVKAIGIRRIDLV